MTDTLFERQMAMYTTFHRDRRNRATHFFGIPAIVVAVLVALALARIEVAGLTVSLAVVVAAAVWLLWLVLDRPFGLAMALFVGPALAFADWLAASQSGAAVWTVFAVLFVGGWALQLWGHVYEGRRPALVSNLFQALIGPMFLVAEIAFALGLRRDLRERIERVIAERYPAYASSGDGRIATD